MRITGIETLAAPMGARDALIVRVHTDEGLAGIGEAYSVGPNDAIAATVADFAGWLEGRDPRDITGLWYHLYLHSRFPGGSVVNAALSGIEHALWDIAGKAAGVPVYRLLGGRCRDRVRVYQGLGGDTPEACADQARSLIERYGYTALKLGPFPPDAEGLPWNAVLRAAAARLAAVRDAVGPDIDLGVDVHARVREPMRAAKLAAALQSYRPFFLEEPLRPENVDAMAWLAQKIEVPIATGENLYTTFGFRELLAKQAATIVQPDVCVCGGLLEMKKIATLAEAHFVSVAPHNPMGPLATAVNVHFAASTHNFVVLEYHADDDSPRRDVLRQPLRLVDGYLELPDAPGLGVELNEDHVRGRPRRTWHRPFAVERDGAPAMI